MAKLSEVEVNIKLNTEEIIKELKSVQREAKKATKAIKELEIFTDDDLEYRSRAENMLNYSIENGILVTDLKENIRGIGKTKVLIKKANELKVPIIVGNSMTMQNIIEYSRTLNLDIKCYNGNHIEELRGKRFTDNSFLVDDTVTNKIIIELQNYGFKCIGGFNGLRASIS